MPKTIDEVLARLSKDDGRREWWETIKQMVQVQTYEDALSWLLNHRDDVDFGKQVQIIAQEIVNNIDPVTFATGDFTKGFDDASDGAELENPQATMDYLDGWITYHRRNTVCVCNKCNRDFGKQFHPGYKCPMNDCDGTLVKK